jgi:hypothetical protein
VETSKFWHYFRKSGNEEGDCSLDATANFKACFIDLEEVMGIDIEIEKLSNILPTFVGVTTKVARDGAYIRTTWTVAGPASVFHRLVTTASIIFGTVSWASLMRVM